VEVVEAKCEVCRASRASGEQQVESVEPSRAASKGEACVEQRLEGFLSKVGLVEACSRLVEACRATSRLVEQSRGCRAKSRLVEQKRGLSQQRGRAKSRACRAKSRPVETSRGLVEQSEACEQSRGCRASPRLSSSRGLSRKVEDCRAKAR